MSLDWNMTAVKDFENLHKSDDDRVVTDMLVWGSLSLDLGEITEKNIDEWLFRMKAFERVAGQGQGIKDGRSFNPGREDMERRIGMRTNVCTKTRKQFLKKCCNMLERFCDDKG